MVVVVLIAEDLLLLLTDDATGKLVMSSTEVDVALGGAMLIELALMGRVGLTGPGAGVRAGRLAVRERSPTSDPLLDGALAIVATKQGKKPAAAVTALGKRLRPLLHQPLADRGILGNEKGHVLGIFPTQRWPAHDATHESSLRQQLAHALRMAGTDDPRVAALVSLLSALRAVHKVVDPTALGLSKKDLDAHAQRIAAGNWGSAAVRRAIDDMMAAVVVATSAAVVASSGS